MSDYIAPSDVFNIVDGNVQVRMTTSTKKDSGQETLLLNALCVEMDDNANIEPDVAIWNQSNGVQRAWKKAHQVLNKVKQKGWNAAIIGNASGFTILVDGQHKALHVSVSKSLGLPQWEYSARRALESVLGSDLAPCIAPKTWIQPTYYHEDSITKMWPRQIWKDDQCMVGPKSDPDTMARVQQFWKSILPNKAPSRKKNNQQGKKKRTRSQDPITFDDVCAIVEKENYTLAKDAFRNAKVGDVSVKVHVKEEGQHPIIVNRLDQTISVEQQQQHVVNNNSSLFTVLKGNYEKNHAQVAQFLAPHICMRLAVDLESKNKYKWRIYDQTKGTWKMVQTKGAILNEIHCILLEQVNVIITRLKNIERTAPKKSQLLKETKALLNHFTFIEEDIGQRAYLSAIMTMLEPYAEVSSETWRSHFMGYLAVANALLHFDVKTGKVQAMEYKPEYYVRQEYQAMVEWKDWNGDKHEGMETLLNQWWDEDERHEWQERIVYGLSRTAFKEVIFLLYGPGGSAKSTVADKLLIRWFGSANVFMHGSTDLLATPQQRSIKVDNQGKGHDSSLMTCFDKAIVFFPEPSDNAVFRHDVVKRMTGDRQAGRQAYSSVVQSVARCYTPYVPCNYLIPGKNHTDTALLRRISMATTHRIFYTDDAHKEKLTSKMSPNQLKEAQLVLADPTALQVLDDPKAISYFLYLLTQQWTTLIVDQKRTFFMGKRSKTAMEFYKDQSIGTPDSIAVFLKSQVELTDNTDEVISKRNLYLAYCLWHYKESQKGSPGPLCKSEDSFKTQVSRYYGAISLKQSKRKLDSYQATRSNDDPKKGPVTRLEWTKKLQDRVPCYLFIKFKDPSQYP